MRMINRVVSIDFGTSTSVVCYCDYMDGKPGTVEYIIFNGHKYVPTLILNSGTIKNKQGNEKHCDEQYGWDAANANSFYALLESNFKMDLISGDIKKRKRAEELTQKFFSYLFQAYKHGNTIRKDKELDSVITYITYPGKFSQSAQDFLMQCAGNVGFENVKLLDEASAAINYALMHDTEETKNFFSRHKNSKLKVMLIDMGAGTTDIAIFEYDTNNQHNCRSISFYPKDGTRNFGGREIDVKLCEFYKQKIGTKITEMLGGGDVIFGEKILLSDVKYFKEQQLSGKYLAQNQLCDEVPGRLSTMVWQLSDATVTNIDRKLFEELLKDYLPQFTQLINGALTEAALPGNCIDLVLLTGGHSQWYFVKDFLCNRTNLIIKENAILSFPEPHLVVAGGAAASYKEPKPDYVPPEVIADNVGKNEKTVKNESKPKNRYESQYREFKLCSSDCFFNWGGCSTKGYQCTSYCECDTVCAAFNSENCEYDKLRCENDVPCNYCYDCYYDSCECDSVWCDREYG